MLQYVSNTCTLSASNQGLCADTPMKAFGGDAVIQLLNKIRQNPRQFKHLPIGPIGSVLSLRNDMWARAVEASIGGFFNNFIVDNDADSRTLSVCSYLSGVSSTVKLLDSSAVVSCLGMLNGHPLHGCAGLAEAHVSLCLGLMWQQPLCAPWERPAHSWSAVYCAAPRFSDPTLTPAASASAS